MNNVILIGRLTRDPELSYTTSQTAKCIFTLAVDRPKKNGADQGADFIRIVVWGKQAENCDRYIRKGRQVAVHGTIRTGSYTNSEGNKVYTTDVWATNVEFLGNRESTKAENRDFSSDVKGFSDDLFGDTFDDMPDTFSAAEDEIPF